MSLMLWINNVLGVAPCLRPWPVSHDDLSFVVNHKCIGLGFRDSGESRSNPFKGLYSDALPSDLHASVNQDH